MKWRTVSHEKNQKKTYYVEKESQITVPCLSYVKSNIISDFGKKYIMKMISNVINITIKNTSFSIRDFNKKSLFNTISYLYTSNKNIIDGANIGMTSIDIDSHGNKRTYNCKKIIARDWESVTDFARNNNSIVLLRNCLTKSQRKSEKNINFKNLFKNNAIWLICRSPTLDDIFVIMLSAIMSILKEKQITYYTNDKYIDHKRVINQYVKILGANIIRCGLKYNHNKGFKMEK